MPQSGTSRQSGVRPAGSERWRLRRRVVTGWVALALVLLTAAPALA
ncbi:MAG: hypothetical protein JXA21_23520 [Anaerolineae bacterium]|nr:hypothetical protein [Anaerolineae bacterium]